MRKSWAISWLIPAVCILLLHTLVPHAHDKTTTPSEAHRCEGKPYGFQHFLEHLLAVDAGAEHLEHTFMSESEQTASFFVLATASEMPTFAATVPIEIAANAIFPVLIPFFDKNFIKSTPFRGPPENDKV
jgi:hypothetical protein